MINQIAEKTFQTTSRGLTLTLSWNETLEMWAVETDSPAARAYNNGLNSYKTFWTLKEVSDKYKSFRGIDQLAA